MRVLNTQDVISILMDKMTIGTGAVVLALLFVPLALAQETQAPQISAEANSSLKMIPFILITSFGSILCSFFSLCFNALYQTLSAACIPCVLACFPCWLCSYLSMQATHSWLSICLAGSELLPLCLPYLRNPSQIVQVLKTLITLLIKCENPFMPVYAHSLAF